MKKKCMDSRITLIFMLLLAVAACKNESSQQKEKEGESFETKDTSAIATMVQMEEMFYNMPSPLQVAALLKQSGASYTKNILSPVGNASKYTTSVKKAINLGIYGTDLAYTNMFGQTQAAIVSMEAITKLADGIGLASVMQAENLYKRFETNLNNQDSLFLIIATLYSESNDYLKENEKLNTASLVLAGGWVEGLYIATSLVKNKTNKEIVKHIGEQGVFLQNILTLLNKNKEDAGTENLITELNHLKSTYDNIQISYTVKEPTTDAANHMTIVNSETTVSIDDAQLKEITDKVESIRNKLISL